MKYSALIVYFSIVLIFNGCSRKEPIVKTSESKSYFSDAVYEGREFYSSTETTDEISYRVFNQASSGFSGTSGIRRDAENRAISFCRKQKKSMLKLTEHTAKPPYILGNFPRIEIIFACVDKKTKKKDKYNQLSKIKLLLDNGTLTQSEFDIEKAKILSQ